MDAEDQFLNEAVMAWDRLAFDLARPVSVDSASSRLSADACALLTVLRHSPERFGLPGEGQALINSIQTEFGHHQLIVDAADSWKHSTLRIPERIVKFHVKSFFAERPDGKFRFLRHAVCLTHPRLGCYDWQTLTRQAIKFWIERQELGIAWSGTPFDGADIYQDGVILFRQNGVQVRQWDSRIQFVKSDGRGGWIPTKPADWHFEIIEAPDLELPRPVASSWFP